MKAITLWEPWASLVAHGFKMFETRAWPTRYRGQLLIHAAKKWEDEQEAIATTGIARPGGVSKRIPMALESIADGDMYGGDFGTVMRRKMPYRGCLIAQANLVDCVSIDTRFKEMIRTTVGEAEIEFGSWRPGRYAWQLEDVVPMHPVMIRGMQGLWEADVTAGELWTP